MGFDETVTRIKKNTRESLYIGVLPEKTKTEFKKLSKEDFNDQYGMCLKWLLDFRSGLLSSPNEQLNAKIDILTDEIVKIKSQLPGTEKSVKMVSGKKLKRS